MRPSRPRARLGLSLLCAALGPAGLCPTALAPPARADEPPRTAEGLRAAAEVHLADLRQVTFGGENAEAYWSFDGRRLTMQSTTAKDRCDQIYLADLAPLLGGAAAPPALRRLSDGAGRTTCSFFSPDGGRVLYSSTRADGPACPPQPDRSQGYVWPLYHYQIYSGRPDGGDLRRLTQTGGYDAEATVCKDGSVVFTSDRDGDLELYRMRLDGSGVTRLTFAPGYDGGAFFSEDCKRIVWRADRPRTTAEETTMKDLLRQRLVRPTRMELWVADADGGNAHQVTDLGGASFAPFFMPQAIAGKPGRRILFSSNHKDPRHREFDIWAINDDGTALEQITFAPDFDGFPMFSPDGRHLAFSSNRGGKARGETNVFVATWTDPNAPPDYVTTPASRVADQVRWLSDPARQGRGVGSPGLGQAAEQIARWMGEAGLRPGGEEVRGKGRGFFQTVEVFVGVRDAGSRLALLPAAGAAAQKGVPTPDKALADVDLIPAAMSESGTVSAPLVFAGYGITAPEAKWDDLHDLAVRDKAVLVLRGVPAGRFKAGAARSYSDLRYKAWNLREHGARAVIFVSPEADGVPRLTLDGPEGGAGLVVVHANRSRIASLVPDAGPELRTLVEAATAGRSGEVRLVGTLRATVALRREVRRERNVIGVLPATGPGEHAAVVLGAHYDHLGMGGRGSMAPDQQVVHPGADDNASGTAALLSAAGRLREGALPFDVYFVAFTGEEVGLVGSSRFLQALPAGLATGRLRAMLNFDMVGRLAAQKGSTLPTVVVQGTDSATEWGQLVEPSCRKAGLSCKLGGDGYGPSDMTPFYAAGVPVLFFFTGAHADYHRPSDTADKINAAGIAQIAGLSADVVRGLGERLGVAGTLAFQKPSGPAPRSGDNRGYGAYLGTIPDYTAMQGQKGGVRLSGARPGSPAESAGVQPGDVLVSLAGHAVDTLEDMALALRSLKPGQKVELSVLRGGKRMQQQVTVGERPAAR